MHAGGPLLLILGNLDLRLHSAVGGLAGMWHLAWWHLALGRSLCHGVAWPLRRPSLQQLWTRCLLWVRRLSLRGSLWWGRLRL